MLCSMSQSCTLVFPHQLFEEHPAICKGRRIFLIEDSLFFGDRHYPMRFHLQKIGYHRLTMQAYQKSLVQKGFDAEVIPYHPDKTMFEVGKKLVGQKLKEFHFVDPDDFILSKRLNRLKESCGVVLKSYTSPLFLTSLEEGNVYFDQEKKYFMASFYTFQRKRLGILVDGAQKPMGGKWSFDAENRKKLPSKIEIPVSDHRSLSLPEATLYGGIKKEFSKVLGNLPKTRPPLTHREAMQDLERFLKERFSLFGEYEDAIDSRHRILFHSYLTPALNIGLITPEQVIQKTLEFSRSEKIPLNSLEGFIRQIIGWREFIRLLYRREGVTMRNRNFFNHQRSIPDSFYTGNTGIPLIDRTIHRLLDHAYCHHIERLMVLGNFMLLSELEPRQVYQWFMEFFIDSYDWVMVPNVYGMSQFADGGIFATKPYISSSNYIMKMSDEKKGDWQSIWDGLFWRFIHQNRAFFESNFRLSMMVKQLDRMIPEKRRSHLKTAEEYLCNKRV